MAFCWLLTTKMTAQTQTTKYLWVGEKYQCDCSGEMSIGLQSMSVQWSDLSNAGYVSYLSFGPGGLRTIQASQYWKGVANVRCSWEEKDYSTGRRKRKWHDWYIYCKSNDLEIYPKDITIHVGETADVMASFKSPDNVYDGYEPFFQMESGSSVASVSYYGYYNHITKQYESVVKGMKPGTGYVFVQSKASDHLPSIQRCKVTVLGVDPTSVTVPSPIPLEVGKSKTLTATVSPSDAYVTKKEWKIYSGSDIVSLSSSGQLKALKPGTATVYCLVNGTVRSNDVIVQVTEPPFKLNSFSPANGTTGVDLLPTLTATFSLNLYEGEQFSSISLKEAGGGQSVEGTCTLSGTKLTFKPSRPLKHLTEYQLDIPAGSLKNEWGTSYSSTSSTTFTTRDLEQLTLSFSKPSGTVEEGDEVAITPSVAAATIYYTTDNTMPTTASTPYEGPITIDRDMRIHAIAVCEGYYDSEVTEGIFFLANLDVAGHFPTGEELFIYDDLIPHVFFNNAIVASDAIENITLTCDGKTAVDIEAVAIDSTLFLVPSTPLQPGHTYSVSIPENAVKTWQNESNKNIGWMFTTGVFTTTLAAGGPELATALTTDGKFLSWGHRFQSGDADTGSAEFEDVTTPALFASGSILQTSTGYMHHAMVKDDHSLWMWGRQYCGEFGNNSTTGSATPVKVMEGVASVSAGGQTTAIVKTDGSLWMCGRNDYGQLGDSTTLVRMAPVKVLDNVTQAAAGWCASYAVTTDGKLWAWGNNAKYQLGNGTTEEHWQPVMVMDDVKAVFASATESVWTAAMKTDGTLWVWGETQPEPVQVADNVVCAAVGSRHLAAVKADGTLWAMGANSEGQLGNNTTSDAAEMTEVLTFADSVACGPNTTYALKRNGSVWAWGSNEANLLGAGKTVDEETSATLPKEVVTGRPYSTLGGVTTRKETFLAIKGRHTVIDALPQPISSIYKDMEWSVENSDIATVNDKGVVRGAKYGETNVTVKVTDDEGHEYERTCPVKVVNANEYWELLGVVDPPFIFLLGDANGDRTVSVTDALQTVNHILNKEDAGEFYFENADPYDDGIITVTDVTAIVSIILGQ